MIKFLLGFLMAWIAQEIHYAWFYDGIDGEEAFCVHCGRQVDPSYTACPWCGKRWDVSDDDEE